MRVRKYAIIIERRLDATWHPALPNEGGSRYGKDLPIVPLISIVLMTVVAKPGRVSARETTRPASCLGKRKPAALPDATAKSELTTANREPNGKWGVGSHFFCNLHCAGYLKGQALFSEKMSRSLRFFSEALIGVAHGMRSDFSRSPRRNSGDSPACSCAKSRL